MERKCVVLLSGGLDSALAARLMCEQGVEVQALFLSMSWGCCEKEKAQVCAQQLGVPLLILSVGDAYLDVIRRPRYGYGSGMNPCVDCRIYMFRIAKRYMEEIGAGFVVTGEVLGQRPMSQMRRPLAIIEADSGLEGLLLRPLSAQLLEPTLPELLGVVDRQRLLRIAGRARQEQMALASAAGLSGYATPAGGCLLTDEHFADKTRDLFAHEERPTTKDMELLTIGRHFRIGPKTKVILGRNAVENLLLEGHAQAGYTCLRPKFAGPSALMTGEGSEEARHLAATLIVHHTKAEKRPEGLLEFWMDGRPWTVDPAAAEAAGHAVDAVKL
ncbi:MAG: 7-cyano-7-deazaguanine synthase [Candidatus Omnitrophota bacterium]|nr:7-cyano-7-deazaguanine synthase [Candidatus Omnitrophota bacterium]